MPVDERFPSAALRTRAALEVRVGSWAEEKESRGYRFLAFRSALNNGPCPALRPTLSSVPKPAVCNRSKESRLLDHLVGAEKERERDRQAKSLCGLDVNQPVRTSTFALRVGYRPL